MDNMQTSRIFGEYIIKTKIGTGGMASVYHAIYMPSDQEVALKILHEHYADDPHIRKRLEHEARIVMRLDHPYIVPVWDFGENDNRPYLVMPYMSGGSLASLFSKPRAIKHEATLKLLEKLASALDYAHAQEVVHRDFKLENILLDANNVPAISDFGIAQSAHTTRITLTGQILGTPQYLAPEVLEGNAKLNHKADLYALAVMAYLMFTGYYPFTAADPISLAVKHRTELAPLPSWVNNNLPTTLDGIFKRGLAKDPNQRFDSAQEFVDAVTNAFQHAALVTTRIFIDELNPLAGTPMVASDPRQQVNPNLMATQAFDESQVGIPSVFPTPQPIIESQKRRPKLALYLNTLIIFACMGASLAVFFLNNGFNMLGAVSEESLPQATTDPFGSFDTNETILISDEEATATPTYEPSVSPSASPSRTPRASRTPRPSSTPIPTLTRRGETSIGVASVTPTPSPTRFSNTNPNATQRPGTVVEPTRRRPSATPIPTATPTRTPTRRPSVTPSRTPVPPTDIPPTDIPPTDIPPTDIPPTDIPPTDIPPTDIPPTDIPPTDIPPPPPTDIPPPPPTDPPPPPPTDDPGGGEEGEGGGESGETTNP